MGALKVRFMILVMKYISIKTGGKHMKLKDDCDFLCYDLECKLKEEQNGIRQS